MHLPLNELVSNYSTVIKKKLALIGLLKLNRSVCILEEPFNGLDLESKEILEIVTSELKNSGKTVLLSSHILSPLLNICEEIQFLLEGQIRKSCDRSGFSAIESDVFGDFEEKMKIDVRSAM
ncbi:MAG: hypothetical protein SGI87_10785 [Flavobacteriales bacterium]|nr:hypothetical protein [Flavobacteriales bacterium]